jgi:hypothetical protein
MSSYLLLFMKIHTLTQQLAESIREIFAAFDLNGDKRLDPKELLHAFASMVDP